MEAARVRRRIRLGGGTATDEERTTPSPSPADDTQAAKATTSRTELDLLLDTLNAEQRAALAAHLSVLLGAQRVPQRVPDKTTPEPEGPRRLLTTNKSIQLQERATGLEPATSSLGSWHSTN
jgi:hypothetical protein